MGRKIDYKSLCEGAIDVLELIYGVSKDFSKFELSKPVRAEIDEIKKLSGKVKKIDLKEPYKEQFSEMMNDICQIEDNLHEIEMVTGELITKANQLPKDRRKAWYYFLGIEDIPKEYEGLSKELQNKMYEMLDKVVDISEESHKYFSLEKKGYVDYEDEVKED